MTVGAGEVCLCSGESGCCGHGLKGRLSRPLASVLPSLRTEMSLQFRIYVSNVTAHEF